MHRARAHAENFSDVLVGLARRQPAENLALARGDRQSGKPARLAPAHQQVSIQRGERLARQVEQRAFALAEVAPIAVQHKAHQQAAVHEQRHRHHLVDADAAVVLVVKRALAEFSRGQRIADAVRAAAPVAGVKTYQRMLGKESVEGRAILRRDRAARVADDAAAVVREIAD